MDTRTALEALKSETCHCGKAKKSRMSHCRKCYFKLPELMRRALYSRIGRGYEEAFEDSCKYLDEANANLNSESVGAAV